MSSLILSMKRCCQAYPTTFLKTASLLSHLPFFSLYPMHGGGFSILHYSPHSSPFTPFSLHHHRILPQKTIKWIESVQLSSCHLTLYHHYGDQSLVFQKIHHSTSSTATHRFYQESSQYNP